MRRTSIAALTLAVILAGPLAATSLHVRFVSYTINSGTGDACLFPLGATCSNITVVADPAIRAAFDAAMPGLLLCADAVITGMPGVPGSFIAKNLPTCAPPPLAAAGSSLLPIAYFGPVVATVGSVREIPLPGYEQFNSPVITVTERWFVGDQGFHREDCVVLFDGYGAGLGSEFVDIPASLIAPSTCDLAFQAGLCYVAAGHQVAHADLGTAFIADTIRRCP